METEEAARRRQFGREGVDRETARIRCEQVWFARGAASEYGALQVGNLRHGFDDHIESER